MFNSGAVPAVRLEITRPSLAPNLEQNAMGSMVGHAAMKTKALRQLLTDLAAILTVAGAKKPASELGRVADLMDGREHQYVEEFLNELRSEIRPLEPAEIAEQHVARLHAAGTDELAFRQAFDALSKDRAVKKPQANSIAHAYIGGREKWPTKAEALAAIEKEFVARRYDQSKMKEVARSRPW